MLYDLIEEAEKWGLAPKPASLWWTSTCEAEERSGMLVATNGLMYKFTFEDKFKILGCVMNAQGRISMRLRKECNLPTRPFGGTS